MSSSAASTRVGVSITARSVGPYVGSLVEHDQSKVTGERLRDRLSRSTPRRLAAQQTTMQQEQRWVVSTGVLHPGRVPKDVYVLTHRSLHSSLVGSRRPTCMIGVSAH